MSKVANIQKRVLLVDDDQALLDGLKRVLRKEPYEIESIDSALGALKIVERGFVDVVVTDQEMPGMTGTELLRLLRARNPETIAIMLTGKANLEVALKAINSGDVYRLFTKPCNDLELALAIREALKQRELISQSRKLIDLMREQGKYIDELECQHPGITSVKRASNGAVIVGSDSELERTLEEVAQELERAELRLGKSKNDLPPL